MSTLKKHSVYFLVLVYLSGTTGFIVKPSFFIPFTPYALALTCVVFLLQQSNKKFFAAFFYIVIIGYLAEVIGVLTGYVFGNYYYGNTLGPKIAGVPIIIPFNWALLVTTALTVASKLSNNRLLSSIFTAILTTGIDFLMEQVASKLDFWYFENNLAGIHNYVAWLIISFSCVYLFWNYLKNNLIRLALIIIVLQVLFFSSIYVFY